MNASMIAMIAMIAITLCAYEARQREKVISNLKEARSLLRGRTKELDVLCAAMDLYCIVEKNREKKADDMDKEAYERALDKLCAACEEYTNEIKDELQ